MRKPQFNRLSLTVGTVAAICFALATLALLDGALPQFQMILTGGHVYIPLVIVKLMIFVTLFLAAIFSGVIRPEPGFTNILWLVFLYLAFDALFLLFAVHVPIADIAVAYNTYYAYLLIASMVAFLGEKFSERSAILFLSIVFLACWLVGTAQFALQKPLLYTESLDGNFVVLSWLGEDSIRAFSVFSSGLAYGTVCSLTGAVGAGLLFKSRQKLLGFALFSISAFGCYTTFTRNCYIGFVFTCCAVLCLALRRLRRLVRYFPILFLIASIVIAYFGVSAVTTDSAVASNLSLLIRVESWQHYLTLYSEAPITEKIFGLGIVQDSNAATSSLLAVDNEFLAILLNSGFLGVVLLFWLQWKMWIRLYTRAITRPSAFTLAIAGFWSTFLALYFYNIALASFCLVYILGFLVNPDYITQKRSQSFRFFHKLGSGPLRLRLLGRHLEDH